MSATNNPGTFANGLQCFCAECGIFFSVQHDTDMLMVVEYCPSCGSDNLIGTTGELLQYCANCKIDPVNFYSAFPPDEPIPQSCTGATPREVRTIVGIVIRRKKEKLPVTIGIAAGESFTSRKAVQRVFEELHISETGGAE
jgi:hypothetical protein